jgi:methylmalonyl-CoA/ethylmalonyl-CoA epimerase
MAGDSAGRDSAGRGSAGRDSAGRDSAGRGSAGITALDHVALAVEDLPRAVRLFVDVLGFEFVGGGDNPEIEVRAVQLRMHPKVKVELLTPLSPDSYLRAYLDRHGEGFHHLTLYTEDVAVAAERLDEAGFPVVDTATHRDSWHETFVRPATAFGALIQVATPGEPWSEPLEGITIDDVLEGRLEVVANVVRWKHSGEVVRPRPAASV